MAEARRTISLTLPAELAERLERARWADKLTRSEWVRAAIEERLDRRDKGKGKGRKGGGGR